MSHVWLPAVARLSVPRGDEGEEDRAAGQEHEGGGVGRALSLDEERSRLLLLLFLQLQSGIAAKGGCG